MAGSPFPLFLAFFFIVSSFIVLFFYFIYTMCSKSLLRLNIVYLILILISLSWFGFNYLQLTKLNNLVVPFTQITGNTVAFDFLPQGNGLYSVDLSFSNRNINSAYEACEFTWEKKNKSFPCEKAMLYRTISGNIDQQVFSEKYPYQKWASSGASSNYPYPSKFDYGYYNHSLNAPTLNIFKFYGKNQIKTKIKIHMDATTDEILISKPVIIIGPEEKAFENLLVNFVIFFSFALPFMISIVITFLFLAIKKIIFRKRKNK